MEDDKVALKAKLEKLEEVRKKKEQQLEELNKSIEALREQLQVEDAPVAPVINTTSTTTVAAPTTTSTASAPTLAISFPLVPKPSDRVPHPRFAQLAFLMRTMQLVGSNCRTAALLHALKDWVMTTSHSCMKENSLAGQDKSDLVGILNCNINLLHSARPLCAGMKYIRDQFVASLDTFRTVSTGTVRDLILHRLNELAANIKSQTESVVNQGSQREVSDGDVIIVVGRSSVVEKILTTCALEGKKNFEVIVLDSEPLFEGTALAQRLQRLGAPNLVVQYAPVAAACTLMSRATKVFIGASSVMENGDVLSRSGTSMVAIVASTHRKPVLCFAESYKYTNITIGSMTENQFVSLGPPPSHLAVYSYERKVNKDQNIMAIQNEKMKNCGFLYDITSASLISAIVECSGRLHPTAIKSILSNFEKAELNAAKRMSI